MTNKEFLAMSLPYGLCVLSECDLDNRDYDEICIYKPYHYTDEFIEKFITSDVQLAILHPLSDLTKEINVNHVCFVPCEQFTLEVESDLRKGIVDEELPFAVIKQLVKWHFDLCGLIEKGEAIDVNTLPENPYKHEVRTTQ